MKVPLRGSSDYYDVTIMKVIHLELMTLSFTPEDKNKELCDIKILLGSVANECREATSGRCSCGVMGICRLLISVVGLENFPRKDDPWKESQVCFLYQRRGTVQEKQCFLSTEWGLISWSWLTSDE